MAAYTTIDDPEAYFQVKLYTGTGSSNAITFDGTNDMQPDVVWIKQRNATMDHRFFNSDSGVQKYLKPNGNTHEGSDSNSLTAFGSDGFTVGSWDNVNDSSDTYVAWCWKESADAGFDIVSFTGNGTARTISHSLSAVPKVLLVKNRSVTNDWNLYHHSIGNTHRLIINNTTIKEDTDSAWNDTTPTSSVFSVGTNTNVNQNTSAMTAFCWAEKQGFSKFGSYIGNGNADGPFVFTGFRPAWVLCRKSSGTGNWIITDTKRNTGNPHGKQLEINVDAAEYDNVRLDILSNGFKLRSTGSDANGSGTSYIYLAFAEAPFVNSNGVPCNAR